MKYLKTSVLALAAVFAMGNLASAGTTVPSHGYGLNTTTSSTVTPLEGGATLIKNTTHGFWVETSTEAGFPSEKVADCNATLLLSAEGAPLAYRSVCSVSDVDGDLWIATIGATKPDFSDCTWAAHAGTGKYAGATGSGQCASGGPITKDGNNSKSTWTGEWVLP
mgnify:FL=1